MKLLSIVLAVVFGAVLLLFAFLRLGMPALLLVGAALALVGWLVSSVRKDPYVGWGNVRALGVMALLASGLWLVISLFSGNWLMSIPMLVLFAASLWGIGQCTARLRAPLPAGSAQVSMAQQNDEAANAFVADTLVQNRRSHARGTSLHLQAENLELLRKNRGLEEEVARLRAEVQRLDSALNDPFYDPA